jgi:hypothetical protein
MNTPEPEYPADTLSRTYSFSSDIKTAEEAIVRLRHRDSEARQQACWRLSSIGDRRALPALEKMALEDRGQVSVEGAFVDRHEPIYPDALDAIRSIYEREGIQEEDIARLTARLHTGVNHPNGTYNLLVTGGEAMRPILHDALQSPEAGVVILAMQALLLMEDHAPAVALLSHPDPRVREAVIRQRHPTPSNAGWHEAVAARLALEPDPELRLALIDLTPYWNHTGVWALLDRRHDSDVRVRYAAIRRLRTYTTPGPNPAKPEYYAEIGKRMATEVLPWLRTETDPQVQIAVAAYLVLFPPIGDAPTWLDVLRDDPDPRLRELAVR